jgi:hypothetical protein
MAIPDTHVHIHQRASAGSVPRMQSKTTRAIAQPAVMTAVTCRSSASRGGGPGRRASDWPCHLCITR